MSDYAVGDRVRDTKWGGEYVGRVNRVDDDGDLYVKWDGHFVEYQMGPGEVRREVGEGER